MIIAVDAFKLIGVRRYYFNLVLKSNCHRIGSSKIFSVFLIINLNKDEQKDKEKFIESDKYHNIGWSFGRRLDS